MRRVTPDDLPRLFRFQLDEDANALAAVYPRDWDAFEGRWRAILDDRDGVARAIEADGVLAGSIGCFKQPADDEAGAALVDAVGYWIGREFWGRGIASRALALMLGEVAVQPLYARVARHNTRSARVLEKCGFVFVRHQRSSGTERYVACEEAVYRLG